LAYALQNLGYLLYRKGQYGEVLQLASESAELYRRLAAAGMLHIEDRTWLAYAIDLARDRLVAIGQYPAAIEAAREYVVLVRQLVDDHPDSGGEKRRLAVALEELANVLISVGKQKEAKTLRAEARNLRSLAEW
jgi:hypothetical protein